MTVIVSSENKSFEYAPILNKSAADNAFELASSLLDKGVNLPEAMAAAVATVCNGRWAAFCQLSSETNQAQILALYDSGHFVDCFTYNFQQTPCEEVLSSEKFCRFEDVQRAFPEDEDLEKMGVYDYAGKAFKNRNGELAGHLLVMHDQPFDDDKLLESVINRLISFIQIEW